MIDLVVFIAGSLVFAITVYGTLMAAGIALTRAKLEDQPELGGVDPDELDKRVPLVKY